MKIKIPRNPILAIIFLFTLNACGGGDDAPAGPGTKPATPELTAIGDKFLVLGEPLEIQLSATYPAGTEVNFSINHAFQNNTTSNNPGTNSEFNSATGLFEWTPDWVWNTGGRTVFQVEFIVSDVSAPKLKDSEVVNITVMENNGGRLYRQYCANCHANDTSGIGVIQPDGSLGTDMFVNVGIVDVTLLTDNISPANGIEAMLFLETEISAEDIIEIVTYVSDFAPPAAR
ncbi:MAG: cytochrome c [Thiohalomonadales bacterium]